MGNTDIHSIDDFGARSGELCTESIQTAIDRAGRTGGTVYFPPGTYHSGTLYLHSGVTLKLDPAATLRGSGTLSDYPINPHTHGVSKQHRHFILARECENVTITGGGTIDGNGPAFWKPPTPDRKWIVAERDRVTPMLRFEYCRHLIVRDIRIVNSPGWTLHPYCCEDVILDGVRIDNNMWGPNTDGIDVDGCRDVFIANCHIRCGDDAIILKATKNAQRLERVVITNCIVQSNCIGIGLGQETIAGIREVTIFNCIMYQSNRMFAIGIWDGGTVENVVVTGCTGDTLADIPLGRAIHIEVKEHPKRPCPLGVLRNVQISNFKSRGEGRILVGAQDGTMVENVTMRDVHLEFTDLEDANQLSPPDAKTGSNQYFNSNLEARRQNAALVAENVRNMYIDGLRVTWSDEIATDLAYSVAWVRNIDGGIIHAPFAGAHGGADDYILESFNGYINGVAPEEYEGR